MNKFYESGYVERWHTNKHVPAQTTGQHSFGMLQLLIILHPNPSANLMQAIIRHDLHESFFGDSPHAAKNEYPSIRVFEEHAQRIFEKENGLKKLELRDEDKLWLKLLDQLEVIFYLESLDCGDHSVILKQCAILVDKYQKDLQGYGYFA